MVTIHSIKDKFADTVRFFESELQKIRTGRATPAIVEHVVVEAYGTKTPLVQLASITTPDPKTIVIQPWDKSVLKDIEKSIQIADIHLTPVVDGSIIRLSLPPLNEENRHDLVKIVNQKAEACRVGIRQQREKFKAEFMKEANDGAMQEDQRFKLQKQMDELVKEFHDTIKTICDKKEQEIMSI